MMKKILIIVMLTFLIDLLDIIFFSNIMRVIIRDTTIYASYLHPIYSGIALIAAIELYKLSDKDKRDENGNH